MWSGSSSSSSLDNNLGLSADVATLYSEADSPVNCRSKLGPGRSADDDAAAGAVHAAGAACTAAGASLPPTPRAPPNPQRKSSHQPRGEGGRPSGRDADAGTGVGHWPCCSSGRSLWHEDCGYKSSIPQGMSTKRRPSGALAAMIVSALSKPSRKPSVTLSPRPTTLWSSPSSASRGAGTAASSRKSCSQPRRLANGVGTKGEACQE
mmetsp:Transcript_88362/g.270431  ORF Transcript_88362/g.270431 Transcript_88362/m.270431 type:complete len:207 (+) Transcript_88362:208-828(+)